MNKEMQIQELANDYYEAMLKASNRLCSMNKGAPLWYAQHLYEAGYRKQNIWISVKDKLPEPCEKDPDWSETVLFRTIQGHIYSGYRYKGRIQTSFYDDDWEPPCWLDESENLTFEDEYVTHWMPLPPPPKAAEEK